MAETPEDPPVKRVPEGFATERDRQIKELLDAKSQAKTEQHRQDERDRRVKEHNDKILIRVTLFGVIVGLAGWWGAWEAHKTRINEERPFIGVEVPAVAERTASVLKVSGKTPALRVHVLCETVQREEQINWDNLGRDDQNSSHQYPYFLPTDSQEFSCFVPQNLDYQPALGENTKYVYGVIKYDQDNGDRHQTPFCVKKTISADGSSVTIDHCGFAENKEPEIN